MGYEMRKMPFNVDSPVIAKHDYCRSLGQEVIFPCLQDLLDFLDAYDTTDCFFRGQSGLWEVTSSLHRHHGSAEQFQKACNISVSALEWLKNNKFISNVLNSNDDYTMAIAQHYGCPTDLIDITTNYRTAAYFATSDNKNQEKTPEGCIWVFTKEDIDELQDILKTNFFGCFNRLPQSLQDKLTQNNYSQLFQFNIPQLSRLNAQNGAFLWDVCGLLKQQLRWRIIGTQFVFKHMPDEKNIFAEDEGKLFPFPNQLESEIMRVLRERKRVDGLPEYYGKVGVDALEKEGVLKNGLPSDIVDNAKGTVFIPLPDYFTPSFREYAWEQRVITQNDYSIKNIDMSNYLECHLPFSENGALTLVQHILKNVQDNSLTDLLIMFYRDNALLAVRDGEEEALIEMVITLSNYLYSDVEIANIIFEHVKMMVFKAENGYMSETETDFEFQLIYGYVNDWVAQYYGCRATKLLLGEGNYMMRFWLPENYEFLDDDYNAEFQEFDKTCLALPPIIREDCEKIPDNAQIFLYQHKPNKIMPYETMKKMFVELVLPQQFAFRRPGDRMFIPDYIDKISLPFFGREIYGISHSISSEGIQNY